MIGERILNYKIEALLGEGGVGRVYLASHTQLGRKVAIKILHPHLVSNPEIRQRFRLEAATLSDLKHINLITLYDYLEDERGLFLITEYAEGSSLDHYIAHRTGPIPEKKALFFFEQILDGLAYAHKRGIVHRDIKPSNLIITREADVKILDFGIAKILKAEQNSLTQTGARLGTILYMSPEQVQGKKVDQRTDIYSLGITLFEMLTGKHPFEAYKNSEYEIYRQILHETLPQARDFYPIVSDHLQSVIEKATAKDPQDRYASCEEFKIALGLQGPSMSQGNITNPGLTNPEMGNFVPPPTSKPEEVSRKPETPSPQQEDALDERRERNNTLLYVILGVLIVVSSVLIYFELTRVPNPPNDSKATVHWRDEIDAPDTGPEVINRTENLSDDEPQVEEGPSPNELLLDSLNLEKEKIQEIVDLLSKERRESLLQDFLLDNQLEEGEFGEYVIRVTVANQREDAEFKDIVIKVQYFDDQNEVIKEIEKELEPVKPGQTFAFQIREMIEAYQHGVSVSEIEVKDLEAPPTLDSLQTELLLLDDKIQELKIKIEDEE